MKEFLHTLPIEQVQNGQCTITNDCVIVEQKIAFFLNRQLLLSVMSLPQHQDAHLLGFLVSEGVVQSPKEVHNLCISADGLQVFAEANIDKDALQRLFADKTLTSGCCVGVSGNMDENAAVLKRFLDTPLVVPLDFLAQQLALFEAPTPLFEQTGCVHKAMLVSNQGTLLCEDIGRHNAIDKVMGRAYLLGYNTTDSVLFVSGRLSLEMVTKALMHRICVVVSKAAATFQAIRAAQEVGITLIGFARGKKFNIYTHSGRIAGLYAGDS
ncbi:MAG: formate dehydrogenase accessory sulfurtransferase FdhD [Helicobacter sp.]|nr:formate dehydrogenase accessory sulfurtransferase FdhD [Helicobacter sp.]